MTAYNVHAYGNEASYVFEALHTDGSDSHGSVERVAFDQDRYEQALEDVVKTLTVAKDEKTGKTFEIAIANDAGTDETMDAELSTFSSSITTNEGNAREFALHSSFWKNRRRLYVASIGNGGTSYWDAKEQAYIKKTGRFTQPDGSPLPTIAALGRVLQRRGLEVSRFSTDSAGGSYSTALMTALPEGQVTHAYFKSRPNITNHIPALTWGARLQIGENYDKKKEVAVSEDPLLATDEVRAAAHAILAPIYDGNDGHWTMQGATKDNGFHQLVTNAKALSRGGNAHGQPAAQDTRAALARQPEAKITLHFPNHDRTYSRHLGRDVREFLAAIGDEKRVEAIITAGGHLLHIAYPTMRASFESYTFHR